MTVPSKTSETAMTKGDNDPFKQIFARKRRVADATFPSQTPGGGRLIGYARVSREDQILDRQIDALEDAGCEEIFQDKFTGTSTLRPGLRAMCDALKAGDVVVVAHLSRLGRSQTDLITIVGVFTELGISIRALREGIDTSKAEGRIMLSLFSAIAEMERETISENTRMGLEAARKRGRVGGRKRAIDKAKARELYELIFQLNCDKSRAAEIARVSDSSLFRWLREKRYSDENGLDDFYVKYDLPNE